MRTPLVIQSPYCFTCHGWANEIGHVSDHNDHDRMLVARCLLCNHSHGSQYPCEY